MFFSKNTPENKAYVIIYDFGHADADETPETVVDDILYFDAREAERRLLELEGYECTYDYNNEVGRFEYVKKSYAFSDYAYIHEMKTAD